jgi:hypothetical protein
LSTKIQEYPISNDLNSSIIAGINVYGNETMEDMVGEYADVWVIVAGVSVNLVSLG